MAEIISSVRDEKVIGVVGDYIYTYRSVDTKAPKRHTRRGPNTFHCEEKIVTISRRFIYLDSSDDKILFRIPFHFFEICNISDRRSTVEIRNGSGTCEMNRGCSHIFLFGYGFPDVCTKPEEATMHVFMISTVNGSYIHFRQNEMDEKNDYLMNSKKIPEELYWVMKSGKLEIDFINDKYIVVRLFRRNRGQVQLQLDTEAKTFVVHKERRDLQFISWDGDRIVTHDMNCNFIRQYVNADPSAAIIKNATLSSMKEGLVLVVQPTSEDFKQGKGCRYCIYDVTFHESELKFSLKLLTMSKLLNEEHAKMYTEEGVVELHCLTDKLICLRRTVRSECHTIFIGMLSMRHLALLSVPSKTADEYKNILQ